MRLCYPVFTQPLNPEVDLPQYADGTRKKLWAKDYSHTYLNSEEHLRNAIVYIENNEKKHNLPALDYKFTSLTPYSDLFKPEIVKGGFDAVIGNPPYVQTVMLDKNSQNYFTDRFLNPIDLFSLFIEKSLKIVNNTSYFSFIIPDAINDRSNYTKTRKYILNESYILKIITLNNVFADCKGW